MNKNDIEDELYNSGDLIFENEEELDSLYKLSKKESKRNTDASLHKKNKWKLTSS